jgi:hypothetical protein
VKRGHVNDRLIDSDNESRTVEYYFFQGDADDDIVSNTHNAQVLYGKSPASEEVTVEADFHIKTHPFRAMKTIITKSRHLARMGKTNFLLDEEEWNAPIWIYLDTLVSFDSFFNNKRSYFIKCSCLKSRDSLNRAVPYFTKLCGMNEREQDAFSKSCSTTGSIVQVDIICEEAATRITAFLPWYAVLHSLISSTWEMND